MKEKSLTTLNEKDTLSDVLLFEELLLNKYAAAMAKCGSGGTRGALAKAFKGACTAYDSVFGLLKERGYIPQSEADERKIKEKLSVFKNFLK